MLPLVVLVVLPHQPDSRFISMMRGLDEYSDHLHEAVLYEEWQCAQCCTFLEEALDEALPSRQQASVVGGKALDKRWHQQLPHRLWLISPAHHHPMQISPSGDNLIIKMALLGSLLIPCSGLLWGLDEVLVEKGQLNPFGLPTAVHKH